MNKEEQRCIGNEDDLKISAVRRVLRDSADALNDPIFIQRCADEFMKRKINQFPQLCAEVRRVNYLKRKEFEDMDNIGGWSESKDFKFDYAIPKELYGFMVNMVSREFWAEDNEKIWRKFMNGIMKGDAPEALLREAKMHYDGNSETHKLKVV